MCGICGFIRWQDDLVPNEVLTHMARQLRHRGPDYLATAHPSAGVGLGHTRLSIIDLSAAAHQPMSNESKMVWIVYNGEIYNYRGLRTELASDGTRFVTQSDTEVILRAYERWGEGCVERLDGMFAFAIWDAAKQQCLCARDRTGKKPLFYYDGPALWAFGSEIKALLAHPQVPDELNLEALPSYLARGYVPSPRTFYRGIQQLEPGQLMIVKRTQHEIDTKIYWDLPQRIRPIAVSASEARTHVRRLVTDAVRKRLIADVPLGAFLSGGIDSTIVTGVMTELMDQPVRSFSIGFSGDARFDETRYARVAAKRFHTDHTEFIVEPSSFEVLEALVYHHDQPFGDSSAIPTFLLSQLARQHVTVALNGDGGDELFAGYMRFAACVLAEELPEFLRGGLAGLVRVLPSSGRQRSFLGIARRFAEAVALPLEERFFRWTSYFENPSALLRPELRETAHRDRLLAEFHETFQASASHTLLTTLLCFNIREYLANDLHVKMDRCSMAHGLETRSPFLDTALIEYVLGLPDSMKLQGFRTKVVLKDAFRDLLPSTIRSRGKQGFGVPIGTWFRGAWKDKILDVLQPASARVYRFLERDAILELLTAHLSGQRDWSHQLWSVLTLEVWLRLRERDAFRQPPVNPVPRPDGRGLGGESFRAIRHSSPP